MSYSTEVMADSPRGYWRLGEASGLPQDSSGNGNHMDVVNGTPVYSQASAIATDTANTAMRFDRASAESVTCPDASSLHLGDVFTLECWAKRLSTSASREESLVSMSYFGGGVMLITNNNFALASSSVGYIVYSTSTITDTTNWHYYVATKNGATCKLYVDNVDVTGSISNLTCANGYGASVGEDGADAYADMILDEAAIYATALSAARISAHYTAAIGSGGAPTTAKDLLMLGAG